MSDADVKMPPLPEPAAWRWPVRKLRGVEWRYTLYETRRNAVPLYTADQLRAAVLAERERWQSRKLWLWQNFVDGRREYWAFDNPYPVHMGFDDPQTLGQPCGYALFKESRNGRPDVFDERVLAEMKSVRGLAPPAPVAAYEGRAFCDGQWLPWHPVSQEVYENRQTWPRDGYEVRAWTQG